MYIYIWVSLFGTCIENIQNLAATRGGDPGGVWRGFALKKLPLLKIDAPLQPNA